MKTTHLSVPPQRRGLRLAAFLLLLLAGGAAAFLSASARRASPPAALASPTPALLAASAEEVASHGFPPPATVPPPVSAHPIRPPAEADTSPAIVAPMPSQKVARQPGEPPDGLNRTEWSSIQSAHEHWLHSFVQVQHGHRARNQGQRFVAAFDDTGFTVQPDGGGWSWGLQLISYGFPGQERAVAPSISTAADGQRLVRQRDPDLAEWFFNDNSGLEQGWTLHRRPGEPLADGEPLRLRLAVRGDYVGAVSPDGRGVTFADPAGNPRIAYRDLKVRDAAGRDIEASFETYAGGLVVAVNEAGVSYPLTIDPIVEQSIVGPQLGSLQGYFGYSVAVTGDTVVIGAYGEDSSATGVNGNQADNSAASSGAAYVFVRSGTNWSQQAYLKASNTEAGDFFGSSVAVWGDTVLIGAYGEASSSTGVNGNQTDNSAASSGAAYVFVRSGTNWSQQAYLKASNTGMRDNFGYSAAVSGDTVVIGALYESSSATGVNGNQTDNSADLSGAAYVFERSGTNWSQQAYLKASNTGMRDNFGYSVAVSGDTVVIGALYEASSATGMNGNQADNSAVQSGAAYVFVRSGTTWSQQAYLKASNTGPGDYFGSSVAVSGDTLVVGAYGEASRARGVNGNQADNSASGAGAAYVFVRSGTNWSQQAYLKGSKNTGLNRFGSSVAVSGDTVVIGEVYGAAYVFARNGTNWSQQAYQASNTGAGDYFGSSVAVSGDTMVFGAIYDSSSARGVNGNQADNSAASSGAAYVFVRSGTNWSQQAYLKASNTGAKDSFGRSSVAVSGDTVVIGAIDEASIATGVNGNQADNSAARSGAAYVFVRSGTNWSQQAYLKASNTEAGDCFGSSVAVSGDTVVIGAYGESSTNNSAYQSGAAYVFVRSGTNWSQQAYLKASNTGANNYFGSSVAVSGDTVVIGAYGEDSSATIVNGNQADNSAGGSGAAYVFVRSGTNWSQQAYLKASNTEADDWFGSSVAVSGDTVVIGAIGEASFATGVNGNQADNSAWHSGAAYVFVRSGTNWSQQAYLKASNTGASNHFGSSVAVSGDTVVIGAYGEDSSATGVNGNQTDNSAYSSGAAYVFERSGTNWSQQAYLKASNTGVNDRFGYSVAISGDTLVVGAYGEGSSATGVNGNQADNSAAYSGAAYVFARSGTTWSQQAYLKASNTVADDNFGCSVAVSGDTVVMGSFKEKIEVISGCGFPIFLFHTHNPVSGLAAIGIPGIPLVRLPAGIGIDFGPGIQDYVTNGVDTIGGYRYIACKQLVGNFVGTIFADTDGNGLRGPGEAILRADFVVHIGPFDPAARTDTVPMQQTIQPTPPPVGITNSVFAREVLKASTNGGFASIVSSLDSPVSVTSDPGGYLTIVPNLPATGIRVPWRSLGRFGIEWFVDNHAYQVQFDPGASPIRMARDQAATNGGSGMTLPASGVKVEVVFAADLYADTVLTPPADYDIINNQFMARRPGRFVLKFDPTPAYPRSGDETYQSVLALDHTAADIYNAVTNSIPIGTEILGPAGPLYGIVNSGTRYAANLPGSKLVYGQARSNWRQSQIIPVNTDDFEVWWHSDWSIPNTSGLKVEFPAVVRRYRSVWPDIPVSGPLPVDADTNRIGKIVIASEQGSGPIATNAFKAWDIYYQNTDTLPGFNPNDEHALRKPANDGSSGEAVYALRDDLGRTNTSDPYVLLSYRDPADTDANPRYRFKVFRVVAEDPVQALTFSYPRQAGDPLEGPYPLKELKYSTNGVRRVDPVSGPWFKSRRNGEVWAKAAGNDGVSITNILVRWYYTAQPSFYWPSDAVYQATQPVPFLDANTGTPRNVTNVITWPDVPGFLQMGETLVTSKHGVSGMMVYDAGAGAFYKGQTSTEIVYDQVNATNSAKRSVRLIDYARTISVPLTNVPAYVKTETTGTTLKFAGLPPLLSRRLSLDTLNHQLRLTGEAIQEATGDPYLLLNVISPSEASLLLNSAFCGTDLLFRQALANLCYQAAVVQEIAPTNATFDSMALTAGYAEGSGFVTLAFNDNPDMGAGLVGLEVIKVLPQLYRGSLRIVQPEAVFDEQLSLFMDADLAGLQDNYSFEWKAIAPSILGGLADQYLPLPTGGTPSPWDPFVTQPADGTGVRSIVSGGIGSIADKVYTCRYTPKQTSHPLYGQWSAWSAPIQANGWLKRVVSELDGLKARVTDLQNATVDTTVSRISQAGKRWEGNVPFTRAGAQSAGLIEAYQSILNRAFGFTIDVGSNLADDDNALILGVGKLSDLYLLLGNEAYADACDPTLSVGTDFGSSAGSIHCFMNMAGGATLLEEELSLLRGRDDLLDRTDGAPVYNHLAWNFLGGNGQIAYVNNYGIREHHIAGGDVNNIDATDAAFDYPQGHGDAWGHYLSAIKYYYRLLRSPNFTWQRRSELITVGGTTYNVDYQDEQKFAKAAAARAQAGSEIVGLAYRDRYKEDPKLQWQGYKDAQTYPDGSKRAWGVDEWGVRTGQGAYLDWVIGNALLPANDTVHTSIDKVDRTTVTELRDLASNLVKTQSEVDKADAGLNPLGLVKDVLPMYELTSADVDAGTTLFEKTYESTRSVLNNTLAVFKRADGASQKLREQSDNLQKFQDTVDEKEMDFRNRLIELYGYPYSDDCGNGGTYPQGYVGPDIYHYMYADPSELTGVDARTLTTDTVTVHLMDSGLEQDAGSAGAARVDSNGVINPVVKSVKFHLSTQGYGFIKPTTWTGTRTAAGQLQVAHSEILQARSRLDRAINDYDNQLKQIDDRVELLGAQQNMNAEEIAVQDSALGTQISLNDAIKANRVCQLAFRTLGRLASELSTAEAEALPQDLIVGPTSGGDMTSIARSAIRLQGTLIDQVMSTVADTAGIAELGDQQAKEIVQAQTSITLSTLRNDFAIVQEVKQIEALVRQEAGLRLEVYTSKEALIQAGERYKSLMAQGERILEERLLFRQKTAANVQQMRYKDIAFRIFRNDALEKFRAQFDVAAAWVYMAARAYDYETCWAGDGSEPQGVRPGSEFLEAIVKTRAIGEISDGYPSTAQNSGDGGLADPMARMKANWDNFKGPLGYNQPQHEQDQFSLRKEFLRIPDGSAYDKVWREALQRCVVPDVRLVPEVARYCSLPSGSSVEPAIVIAFATKVEDGFNFFGWPLAGGDNAYSATVFATKIQKTGVWFANYDNTSLGLANKPYVYLAPLGASIMRSPRLTSVREWRVAEQVLPTPLLLSQSEVNNLPAAWVPALDGNSFAGNEANIRRFSEFRAYHDAGSFNASQLTTDTRLIGRSVWNDHWLLVIRGRVLLSDPNEGIQRFINGALQNGRRTGNGISDIKISFQTYAVQGF